MKNKLFALLMIVVASAASGWRSPAGAMEAERGAVEGRLLSASGGPIPEAIILFFSAEQGPPPNPSAYWRLPDGGGPIAENGHFLVNLPAGQYWYGAIKRPHERKGRQPRLENWLYLGREEGGGLARVTVAAGQTTSLAELKGAGPLTKGEKEAEVVQVAGTVKEGSGKPLVGFVVEAFARPGNKMLPLFSSDHLGEDGSFSLHLPPGDYELQLRPVGRPERENRYQLTEPANLAVVAGQAAAALELRVLLRPE